MISVESQLPAELVLKKFNGINVRLPDTSTHLDFLLTRHTFAEDLPPDFKDRVQACDVVLLEGVGWNSESQEAYIAIANGDEAVLNDYKKGVEIGSNKPGFDKRVQEALFDSGKHVRFCDLPASKKTAENVSNVTMRGDIAKLGTVDGFIRELKKQYEVIVREGLYLRDKYMLRNVYASLLSPYESGVPKKVTGLFVVGAVHRTIPHVLRQRASLQAGSLHSIVDAHYGDTRDMQGELYLNFLQGKPITETDVCRAFLDSASGRDLGIREIAYNASPEGIRASMVDVLGRLGLK